MTASFTVNINILPGYILSGSPDGLNRSLKMGQPGGMSRIDGVFREVIHGTLHIEGFRREKNRRETSLSLPESLSFTDNASLGTVPTSSTSLEVTMAEMSALDIHDSRRLGEIAVIAHF